MDLEHKPIAANELQRNPGDPIHNSATLDFRGISGFPAALFLNPDSKDFENVSSGDDEVGNGPNAALRGPFGFKIFGLVERNLGREISTAVGDEA